MSAPGAPAPAVLTLTDFLLARVAEDERAVGALLGATVRLNQRPDFYGAGGPAAEAYWQRFDPTRVLAECTVKRRIVEHAAKHPLTPGDSRFDAGLALAFACVLRYLALPYAAHPDYRDEWKVAP